MDLGSYWWVPLVAAAIGGPLVSFIGYFKRQRHEPAQSTIRGAVMMDSSIARNGIAVGEDMAESLRRMADAFDKKVAIEQARDVRDQQESQRRRDAAFDALKRENDELKRGKT